MIGITPLIGDNDVQGEVFLLPDAQTVLTYAQTNGIDLIAFWSAARDRSCDAQNPPPTVAAAYSRRHTSSQASSGSSISSHS